MSCRNPQISLILRWQDDGVTRLQEESVCLHGMEVQLVKLLGTKSCELWGESMFEALEVSKHIVVLPAPPDLEVLMIMLRKLIAKEDQTTNLEVLLLQLFLLLSRPLLLFLLPPQYFVCFLCQDQLVALGRVGQKHHQRKEKEDLSKLFNFWPSRAKSSDSSFNVPLFTVTWICLNGMGSSFWIHLNIRPHTKNKRCNKIHFWSEGTCSPPLSSEAPSTFVVDDIGNFWAVLFYTIRKNCNTKTQPSTHGWRLQLQPSRPWPPAPRRAACSTLSRLASTAPCLQGRC